ncbi:DUF3658 domain-containing protein [Methylobacterium sp. NPDC080182]|uniref:DUF3658 domain-containing protein n=1 Tax=Methylobacterium sp. NPDC080182 TaxID=3390590 RepID=UPI003CFF9613
MSTLHIAPSDSAGGSISQALRDAGLDNEVLRFRDDLSCGPIHPLDPAARAAWWSQWYDGPEIEIDLNRFWERIATTDDYPVVWFSRHSASEYCFFLALNDWLGERPFYIIDVTGRQVSATRRDGSTVIYQPQSVSVMGADALKPLFGQEILMTAQENHEKQKQWQHLRSDNAAFRIIAEAGLNSTTIDHFDPVIEAQVTTEWQSVASVIGRAFGEISEPYSQVGDLMLQVRLVALVEQGRLLAEGDPWERSSCIRLPAVE